MLNGIDRRVLVVGVVLGACRPEAQPGLLSGGSSEGEGTTESGGTSTGGSSSGGSSTGDGDGGSTSAPNPTSGSMSDPCGSFALECTPTDMGPLEACDVWAQDCPEGEKCAPYADDGGGSWNSAMCVSLTVDPAQIGEPCHAPGGGFGGVDDCEFGSKCWKVDAENMGTCVPLCEGSPEAPECSPGSACGIWDETLFGVCLDGCDPLAQDCGSVEEVCLPTSVGDGFLCVIKNPEESGQVHDVCSFPNDCDAGLLCQDPAAAVECLQDVSGCCEPFCDLEGANMCPGQGQECVPLFAMGMAPPGYENVGRCSVPM